VVGAAATVGVAAGVAGLWWTGLGGLALCAGFRAGATCLAVVVAGAAVKWVEVDCELAPPHPATATADAQAASTARFMDRSPVLEKP
jgi:hypothetical protein